MGYFNSGCVTRALLCRVASGSSEKPSALVLFKDKVRKEQGLLQLVPRLHPSELGKKWTCLFFVEEVKCVLGEVWIQSDHKKPPQWTKAAKAISLFCRSRRVVTEGLFCIYVFISVFRILGYTSCRTGTLGSGIRVEINVCGSTTEDDFFVQPNEQLLGRTTP